MNRSICISACVVALAACSSGGAEPQTEPTSNEATTSTATTSEPIATATASAAPKPIVCEDDQNCFEQGALALMVNDKEKAAAYYKIGCDKKAGGKSCGKLAELQGKPATDTPKKDGDAKGLPGANVTIGSATNDGLAMKDISCIVKGDSGLGGLLGSLTVVAGISKKKNALDACSKGSTETRVHFWQAGGRVTKAQAEASDPKVKACVEKALVGAPATTEAECAATITHGK